MFSTGAHLLAGAATLFIALAGLPGVSAQPNTTAVCQSSFVWMDNSLGQSPCLIAAYMQAVCTDGTWNVPQLLPSEDRHYIGPTADEANPCECSSVVYNLISACAACQGDIWENWSLWSFNCTSSILSVPNFPLPIPSGTAVPGYAFYDPRPQDRFNVTEARTLDSNPDSTFVAPTSTSSSTTVTSPLTPGTSPATSIPPATSTSSKSSTPVGPIVGGVVGGIAALGIFIALVAWIIMRNKKPPIQPQYSGTTPPTPFSAQPLMDARQSFMPQPQPFVPPVLYNPDDPSTFPNAGTNPTGGTVQTSYARTTPVAQF